MLRTEESVVQMEVPAECNSWYRQTPSRDTDQPHPKSASVRIKWHICKILKLYFELIKSPILSKYILLLLPQTLWSYALCIQIWPDKTLKFILNLTCTLSLANSGFSVMCCRRRPGVQIIMLQVLTRFHSYFKSFPPTIRNISYVKQGKCNISNIVLYTMRWSQNLFKVATFQFPSIKLVNICIKRNIWWQLPLRNSCKF